MKLVSRDYQTKAAKQVIPHKHNLITLPMRAGKTHVMSLVVEHLQAKKVLILVGYRKVVEQFEDTFPHDSTFILAGKPFDHTKRIHLASHQTFNRRDIDLAEYDLVIIDELHSRQSKVVMTLISNAVSNKSTVVSFTGTPLTNANRIITKGIDKHINTINVVQMLQQGYLAPTRFFTNGNILGDNATDLKKRNGDYTEEAIRQVITKSTLLENIVDLVAKDNLATKHKTLIYVNFIQTAQDLYDMLNPLYANVFILHSKLSNNEQTRILAEYQAADNAVIISIRSLSLGFDSPTSDRLVFGLLTSIHSLALQILWRASTLDPNNPNKETVVYDMLGILKTVNAFTDFKDYSKKCSCKDECAKIENPMERYFCIESCAGEAPSTECNGEMSLEQKENPYLSDYLTEGDPCGETVPLYRMKYQTIDLGDGFIEKHATCPCGCHTSYKLQTMTSKADMILAYDQEVHSLVPTNSVVSFYDRKKKRALCLMDNPSNPRYKIMEFTSSEQLFTEAVKFFKEQPFTITSNIKMPKLPNVNLNKALDGIIPLIDWDLQSQDGFIKKLIKFKLEDIAVNHFHMKKGFIYYKLKLITSQNQKEIFKFLNDGEITKTELIKFFNKIEKQQG